MKTKTLTFILLSLFLLTTFVSAASISFSPASIIWDVKKGQEVCKSIYFSSDTEYVGLNTVWAQSKYEKWSTNFKVPSQKHSIVENYNTVQKVGNNLEVCYTFKKKGEYHGILFLSPQNQKGNQHVGGGIWLKAIVN